MFPSSLGNGPKVGGEVEVGGQSAQSSNEQTAQSSNEQVAQSSNEQVAQVFGDQVPPAFPPEPPAVLESCDIGESLSSGSFSRVSAVPFTICEFPLPAPEFPEDWDDAGDGLDRSPDLQSQASQDGVLLRGGLSSPGTFG